MFILMNFVRFHVRIFQRCVNIKPNKQFPTYYLSSLTVAPMSTQHSEIRWRGVPITEIYGSQSPWGAPEFPLVTPSHSHSVLYHVPSNGCLAGDGPPKPQIGQDKWDQDHVRMPCSNHSLYPVQDVRGETHLKKRWDIIVKSLSKPISNSKQLADAILSYNTKFKRIWKFKALHKLFDEYLEEEESQYFFDVTLPLVAKLALSLPRMIQAPIPLLKQNMNHSVSLSLQQIACLLANAFFCTFPRRNTNKSDSEYSSYPHINFNLLYENNSQSNMEKLKCICHYFRRVCTKVPGGVATFRRGGGVATRAARWAASGRAVASPLHVDPDLYIEDAAGLIQVDFANKYLGGGVLGLGCVQEEIRFVICPELMVSMLFTEVMKSNEAVMMIGCSRYSKYTGYGNTFQWAGDYIDTTPLDSSFRRRCAVLAIDATPYASVTEEFTPHSIVRELNKAWIGFSMYNMDEDVRGLARPGVASGNWGCGAFGGSAPLKALLQLSAAARAARPLALCTFGDTQLRDSLAALHSALAVRHVTVGQLFTYILQFCKMDVSNTNLYDYLHQVLLEKDKNKTPVQIPEPMDTSVSETFDNELSSSLRKEFAASPDLFSQDDADQSIDEIKIDINPDETLTKTKNQKNIVENELHSKEMHPQTSLQTDIRFDSNKSHTSKTEACLKETNESYNQTSRLFDEIGKLDDANGKLNLSATNVSFHDNSDVKEDLNTSQSDPMSQLKKKVSRKITDYFGKKTI